MADTKNRLHALVATTPGASDKSLLLQTVALFEALLAKIHGLQDENEKLKAEIIPETKKKEEKNNYDSVVLELESTRKQLQNTLKVFFCKNVY